MDGGSARRKAATYTGQHEHRLDAQTSMPWVGFEPTVPASERANTVHALDRAATVILLMYYTGICLKGLRKTTKTSVRKYGIWADIRTDHLRNASLEHFH
jgi:hypothetical protein